MFSTALIALDLAPAEQPIIDCLAKRLRVVGFACGSAPPYGGSGVG